MKAIKTIKQKSEPVSERELKLLRREFRKHLARKGIRQTEWCHSHGIKDSLLANTLAGRVVSRPVINRIATYLLAEQQQT